MDRPFLRECEAHCRRAELATIPVDTVGMLMSVLYQVCFF